MIAVAKFLGKAIAAAIGACITFAIALLWVDSRDEFFMTALFIICALQWHLILFGRN